MAVLAAAAARKVVARQRLSIGIHNELAAAIVDVHCAWSIALGLVLIVVDKAHAFAGLDRY